VFPRQNVDSEVRGEGHGAVNLKEKGVVGLQKARKGSGWSSKGKKRGEEQGCQVGEKPEKLGSTHLP